MEITLGLLALIVSAGLRRDPRRARQDALTAIYYFGFVVVAYGLVRELIRLRPATYDAGFLAADHALGLNPFVLMHWVAAHGAAAAALGIAYRILAPVVVAAWLIEQNTVLRRALFIGGIACFLFYYLFPAVGPGITQWISVTPPNCMPSMHLTWALLIAWNARARWLRVTLWSYAALLAVSTIGLGEHYYIDLIAAVPYTAAVQWAARRFDLEWLAAGRLGLKMVPAASSAGNRIADPGPGGSTGGHAQVQGPNGNTLLAEREARPLRHFPPRQASTALALTAALLFGCVLFWAPGATRCDFGPMYVAGYMVHHGAGARTYDLAGQGEYQRAVLGRHTLLPFPYGTMLNTESKWEDQKTNEVTSEVFGQSAP